MLVVVAAHALAIWAFPSTGEAPSVSSASTSLSVVFVEIKRETRRYVSGAVPYRAPKNLTLPAPNFVIDAPDKDEAKAVQSRHVRVEEVAVINPPLPLAPTEPDLPGTALGTSVERRGRLSDGEAMKSRCSSDNSSKEADPVPSCRSRARPCGCVPTPPPGKLTGP
jgi:hypothetical protein